MTLKTVCLACSIAGLAALPSLAAEAVITTRPGVIGSGPVVIGGGSYMRPRPSVGTPGPVAGVGLAFLALGGGYLVLRHRRRSS